MDHFPGDITTIILSRIPSIRYALCCRSVCKKWREIIDDPQFSLLHFTQPSQRESGFLLLSSYTPEIYMVEQETQGSNPHLFRATKLEITCPASYHLSSNPCNGLVGFCTSFYEENNASRHSMYLCNIATQDCVKLPDIHIGPRRFSCDLFAHNLGLGFDKKGKRFKLLLAIYRKLDIRHCNPIRTYILTVGSNSWRKLDQFGWVSCLRSSPVFVNGSLHWLTGHSILSFDLASETFFSMKIPLSASPLLLGNFQLLVLGECLTIVDTTCDDHSELWMMKEYNVKESWSKLVIMKRYADGGDYCRYVGPILLGKNGEILSLYDSGVLVSFEAETGKYTPLGIEGFPSNFHIDCYRNHPFVRNIMPLKVLCGME